MDHLMDKDLELKNTVSACGEEFLVSTIKMEVRHSWLNQSDEVFVYETMVFENIDGKIQYQTPVYYHRYPSYEEAKEGHENIVKNLENVVSATRECRAKIEAS